MIDTRSRCQLWIRCPRGNLARHGLASLGLLAASVACGPGSQEYPAPMQLSLLEHFDVAERRGPSERPTDISGATPGVVTQSCNSSLAYHFVMPEAARLIGSAAITRGSGSAPANLVIEVTDRQGRRRTLLERSVEGALETLSLDEPLGAAWRDMMKIEVSLACESDDELRIRWNALNVAGMRPAPPPAAEIARDHYNVLVILLDSLRADHIQPYGSKTIATPWLQALADEGVSFLAARSTASWTRPAAASLLTSQRSLNHGVLSLASKLRQDIPYLPSILQQNGYETILIANNVSVSSAYGFDRGFTRDYNHFGFAKESDQRHYKDPVRNANEVWDKYIAPAANAAEHKPFFVYLHERDPHAPYRPPPPFDEMYPSEYEGEASSDLLGIGKLRIWPHLASPELIEKLNGLYSGEVSYMDRYVGALLERLEEIDPVRKTLVVFVSDHGEEFWDHDSIGHGHTVYDELLKIPLIMRLKGVLPAGLATQVPIDLADVTPTILDVLGIDPPATLQGSTALPYALAKTSSADADSSRNREVNFREHFSTAQANSPRGTTTPTSTSLVYRDWKLIHTPDSDSIAPLRLFDLANDPSEKEDVAGAHPVVVGTLDQMRRWMRRDFDARQPQPEDTVDPSTLDPATEQNLRALGYIE